MNILFLVYTSIGCTLVIIGIIFWIRDETKKKRCVKKVTGRIVEITRYYGETHYTYVPECEYIIEEKRFVKKLLREKV